jgi:signal transduction histidine kinase
MVLSHILVASLSTLIVWLAFLLYFTFIPTPIQPSSYTGLALLEGGSWEANLPDGLPLAPGLPPGFAVVVGVDNRVLHAYGDTSCRSTSQLAECAPLVTNSLPGERLVTLEGEQWAEILIPLRSGERVIARFKVVKAELALNVPLVGLIYGNVPYVAFIATVTTILSIPVALLLAWLLVRPLVRRVRKVAQASQRFARGELETRVGDNYPDEVGELAHQFDEMADTLQQNLVVLRDLAQRNAELASVAEQAAIQSERIRLSRDLHDEIAQRVFSLSVSSASLPTTLEHNPAQAVGQAQAIAILAEQTLVELRTLLVELRPTKLEQHGLAQALQTLCQEWSNNQNIKAECSVVLNGMHLPAGVEEVIFRVAQESLNNIAKHAQAHSVQVSLVQGQKQITLSVTDDGRGFDPTTVYEHHKFGLLGMRERAQSVGGRLAIESDTACGTTIRLTLPLQLEMDEN